MARTLPQTKQAASRLNKHEVYYYTQDSKFLITDVAGGVNLTLVNNSAILVRPHSPLKVSTGVSFAKTGGMAVLVSGSSRNKKILVHIGLIDPNFKGTVSVILFSASFYNRLLHPGDLTIYFSACYFYTPPLIDCKLLCHPQYIGDAGYDFTSPVDFMIFPHTRAKLTFPFPSPLKNGLYVPIVLGRSGQACKGLRVKPTRWEGEGLSICLKNFTSETKMFLRGERICQIMFIRKDHLKGCLHFFTHLRLGSLFLKGARVSFVDVDEDIYKSLVTLPARTIPARSTRERGNNGFGSTGTF